jgi:hypothetical protein
MGHGKRIANVPWQAIAISQQVSKADLLEALWDAASSTNPTSCDDEDETIDSLLSWLPDAAAKKARRALRRSCGCVWDILANDWDGRGCAEHRPPRPPPVIGGRRG